MSKAFSSLAYQGPAYARVGNVALRDLTPHHDSQPDALANLSAAVALIASTDHRRFRRLQRDVETIGAAELVIPVRGAIGARLVFVSRATLLREPVEAIALILVFAATSLRIRRNARIASLDEQAQERRRVRLEMLAFADRLDDPEPWRAWIEMWMGTAPLGTYSQRVARRTADMQAYGLPDWLVRLINRARS